MRVLVYLRAGVFSYQYHRSVCDESVGLSVCCVFSIKIIGRYMMRLWVYLCADVFSYLNHR